jgi:hypothetical protein
LNEIYQPVVYADDVNLLSENINTAKKNTKALLDTNQDIGPEVNTEKTKLLFISHHQKCRTKSQFNNSYLIL